MKSWIEISPDALAQNFRAVQAAVGPAVQVLAVVKANAYGHDATLCAPVLAAAGAGWLGVSDLEEALRVREGLGSGDTRLLVMCGIEPEDAAAVVHAGLTAVVWTAEQIAALQDAAAAAGQRVSIHLEIDTGMGRQGLAPGPELARILQQVAGSPSLVCEGLLTHLCSAEVCGGDQTPKQRDRFGIAIQQVLAAGIRPRLLHLGNTSAVDEGSTLGWVAEAAAAIGAVPMVRAGLALYGHALPLQGQGAAHLAPHLQPALTWKTRILSCREVDAGATVGYGATFTAGGPRRLALLPVGYSDGFRREASSGIGSGWVMLRGQRAPVAGRVSMNLTVVDVTGIPEAAAGDEVTLLGPGVSADDHARWCGTIPYEIFCGLRAPLRLV